MRTVLDSDNIQAKRELLTEMVINCRMERTFGNLLYTVPLSKLTGK